MSNYWLEQLQSRNISKLLNSRKVSEPGGCDGYWTFFPQRLNLSPEMSRT